MTTAQTLDGAAVDRGASLAVVKGEPLTEIPADLFIPPQALKVFLDAFEGPLDLLLYLIKRQNFDIVNVPIARITDQYMRYIDMMDELRLDLAGEYLLMAAVLAEIKSKLLLPRPVSGEADDDDPRAELVRRLREYERYKQAAGALDALPRLERDVFAATVAFPDRRAIVKHPDLSMDVLLRAFAEVLVRADLSATHHIKRDPLSVRERMTLVLERIAADEFVDFYQFFVADEGRGGVVVTLLAVLELLRGSLIEAVQNECGGTIYIKAAG